LYEHSASLHEQLHTLVPQAQDSIARVRDAVGQRASRDLDRSCSARVEAAAMLKRVDGINCSLRHGMREIAACGSAIDASVADAVRLLQFEDIAAQSLTAASMHLDRLGTINEATTLREPLDRSGGGGHSLDRLGQGNTLMRSESKRPPHKPVRQRSMDAGSVELF
ncbi:MAG: methyl-accepting chemotaxis protein, partial [Lysobacter sp.]